MIQEDASPLPDSLSATTKEELAAVSAELNTASNELGKPIETVERYLEILNLGVPAWVKVKGWESHHGEFWSRELGYDQIGNSWHVAIRETHGHEAYPDQESSRTWSFNTSPRKARISAIDKLPELLDELVKVARRTARRLQEKTAEATAFAESLKPQATKTAKK
jgi:hypothetical protein